MPPRAKISREAIIEAGLALVRREGAEALNVRRVAAELGCSTQPVMYQFPTMADLRDAIYRSADAWHSQFLMAPEPDVDPLLSIGLRYVRFGAEERHLFRFLFQSDQYAHMDIRELLAAYDAPLAPVYAVLQAEAGCGPEQCRAIFAQLFITAHGLASLLANNAMRYDPEFCSKILVAAFEGAMKGEEQ
ncbi:MAG: WHG domain-containing protein [Clostridia bacterium]|nr:WHG domain-containing protein [Clostridia bacterium]